MIRDFSKEEERAEEAGQDTELTLGGGSLLVLGGGLIVICILCFGLGYSLGHGTSSDRPVANIVPTTNSRSPLVTGGSGAKPTAAGQQPPRAQAQTAPPSDNPGAFARPAQVAPTVADKGASSLQSEVKRTTDSPVRPALQSPTGVTQSSPTLQVMPAMTKVQGWMVQIAAVSHAEDAEVLVNALRKRGYSVTARRDTGDSLIHVQTGPFVNRNDANAMRQKLLNDGYNAIVQ